MHTRIRNLFFALVLCSCGNAGNGDDGDDYTPDELQAFRRAIPSESRLEASTPASAEAARARAETAGLAKFAIDGAMAVNRPVRDMVRLLRVIVALPPTVFDSVERKFLWGPFPNDDGAGEVLVYIQENEPGADFKYGYAFLRLSERDLATARPVIWGAATPHTTEDDKGVGVTLWDFEESYAFEEDFDPDFDETEPHTRGRFAAAYGHGDESGGELYFNVAVFRDFLPEDAAKDQEAADLDYFYGRFEADAGERFDFMDWQTDADLCDATPETCFENDAVADAKEAFGVRAVFFNQGIGRGEATLAGGDLSADVGVAECWNALLSRTFSEVTSDGVVIATTGACDEPFDQSLDELGVPSLAVVPDDLMDPLTCVAENGIENC